MPSRDEIRDFMSLPSRFFADPKQAAAGRAAITELVEWLKDVAADLYSAIEVSS